MTFYMKMVIGSITDEEAKKLMRDYGSRVTIYAQHSYSGTMICCEDEEDFDKLCNDEDYAEERIIDTTSNF